MAAPGLVVAPGALTSATALLAVLLVRGDCMDPFSSVREYHLDHISSVRADCLDPISSIKADCLDSISSTLQQIG